MSQKIYFPRFVGANRSFQNNQSSNSTKQSNERRFRCLLLPNAASYYRKQFPNIEEKHEWVSVHCCFHSPDKRPSLSINTIHGHFRCHACHAKGSNIIDFHKLRFGISFLETINYFKAWSYE